MRVPLRVTAALFLLHVPAFSADLPECGRTPPPERPACRERWAASTALDWRAWRDLELLLADDPAAGLAVLDTLAGERADLAADPRVRGRLADLKAAALSGLGRVEPAADAWAEALRADDGVVRLAWPAEDDPAPRLVEIDPGGRLERAAQAFAAAGRRDEAQALLRRALSLGASAPDEPAAALEAPRWFPALPALALRSIDGQEIAIPPGGPKVLLIDFWASWCVPCADELPRLQSLFRKRRDEGLAVVTINLEEPEATARMFAEALGLDMPIVVSDGKEAATLHVESLPALIVVDRLGRIRRRWDGNETGLDAKLAELVDELLDDARAVSTENIAEVVHGAGLYEPLFSVEFPARIDGFVALGPGEVDPGGWALIVAGGNLALLASDGGVLRRHEVGRVPGLLRRADLDGDGSAELLGFRRGAREVALLDAALPDDDAGDPPVWQAPAPVLALELVAARGAHAGQVLLGTTAGLYRATLEGPPFEAVEGPDDVLDIAFTPAGTFLLQSGGRLWRLDDEGRAAEVAAVDVDARSLLAAPRHGERALPGLAPAAVRAATALPPVGEAARLAVATAGGQLVVLDAAQGTAAFRARWDGIQLLGSGDADGDGAPELVVIAGRRLSALRAATIDRP